MSYNRGVAVNEIETLRRLSAAAAGEAAPKVDAVGGTLWSIRQGRSAHEPVLWLASALAAAVAAAAVIAAFMAWAPAAQDPLLAVFSSFTTVLQ